MKVTAELKEMYKITVGDCGMCMGHYYPEDDWSESYYGNTVEEIAKKLNVIHFRRLPMDHFAFEKWNILVYEGKIYDHKLLASHSRWSKETELKEEHDEFFKLWNSDEYKESRKKRLEEEKIKEEEKEKMERIKRKKEEEQKELELFKKLNEKYGN
jgi:hypothetical protein